MNAPQSQSDFTQDVTMWSLNARGLARELDTQFGYSAHDPYAVTITFRSNTGDVEWVVGRDLLVRGMNDPAGIGDVRVWPSIDETGAAVVTIEFDSPGGYLLTQTSSAALQRFLTRTYAVVPVGTEHERLDLDLLVADLLRGSQTH